MEILYKLTSRKALAVGIVLFLLLLIVLAMLVDWPQVFAMLAAADLPMLAAGMGLLVLGYLAFAERWRYLLGTHTGFFSVFHTANVGSMVNTLLPGRPGDPMRVLLLSGNRSHSVMSTTSSLVVERWFEQIMRMAALGGALVFGAGAHVSMWTMLGSAIFLIGSFLVIVFLLRRRAWVLEKAPPIIARLPRITDDQARHWLGDLIVGLAGISNPGRLLSALIWSLTTWILFWGFHFLCLAALHPYLPSNQLLAISLGSLALVPPSATTIPGAYQMSMVVPMALVGYDRQLLTSYSLVMNLLEMAVVLLLGVWGTFAAGLSLRQLLDRAQVTAAEDSKSTRPRH